MFMLVSRRYERASLIVTSATSPSQRWGEIFGDDVAAAAMIDRLVHHAEILALKGDSYRLKDRDLARPARRRLSARGERRSGSPYGLTSAPPAADPPGGPLFDRRYGPKFRPALTTWPAMMRTGEQAQGARWGAIDFGDVWRSLAIRTLSRCAQSRCLTICGDSVRLH